MTNESVHSGHGTRIFVVLHKIVSKSLYLNFFSLAASRLSIAISFNYDSFPSRNASIVGTSTLVREGMSMCSGPGRIASCACDRSRNNVTAPSGRMTSRSLLITKVGAFIDLDPCEVWMFGVEQVVQFVRYDDARHGKDRGPCRFHPRVTELLD